MAVTARTLRLVEGIRRQVDTIVDEQTRDLVRSWADAWDEVAPDLNDVLLDMLTAGEAVTRTQLLRSSRLRQALIVIADQLETLSTHAGVRIVGDLQTVIDHAGSAQASVIDSQLPPGFMRADDLAAWSRVDARQISAIVDRATQQITAVSRPLSEDAMRVVRRELIRGVAAGSNPRETARRMVARAEGGFNGGLTRALGIARTETLDAHRAAAHTGRLAHADVLAGWRWHCELSTRSCPACIAMDGQLFPVDAAGPNDHVNGRCTAVPEAKSWAELGIDLEEPASLLRPAVDRFAEMSAADQRTILGPSRFSEWQAGRYPPESWAVTRANSGWRDSVQVSPAPGRSSSGGRRAARLAS